MRLYTSLVRLKQAMNGGTLPPMTPVPESVHHLIDPAFTIGLGALREDEEKGLQCPVRDCGEWRHRLSSHLRGAHRNIGGVAAVRRALSIPSTAPLMSQRALAEAREQGVAAFDRYVRQVGPERVRLDMGRTWSETQTSGARTKRRAAQLANRSTVGARNLADTCDAQVSHKLIDLQVRLGRSPGAREASKLLGAGVYDRIIEVYGTWRHALAQLGLDAVRKRNDRESVLAGLEAYFQVNGHLPSRHQASLPTRTPKIVSPRVILATLGETTWYGCMRKAAIILNIRDGRYGVRPIADYYADDTQPAETVAV